MRFYRLCGALVLCAVMTGYFSLPAGAQQKPVDAKAAIVMDAVSGRVLFAQNPDVRLPIASTTKIMTALLALEEPDVYAQFEVDEKAIRVEGSSMGLQPGDKASLYALAQGMLLASGNDGANAAAVRIAGTLPAFAEQMNTRAKRLGMLNSSFETPSGLDGEAHYSTAYDMAILTKAALRNEDFAKICAEYRMKATYGNPPYERWLLNHNKLLNYFEGTIGVKTGFTKKAGRCLVSAAQRDGITLICVTLNCSDDWNVHESLYERFFPMQQVEDLSRGVQLPRVPVAGGTAKYIQTEKYETAQYPLPVEGAEVEYIVNAPAFLYAPVRKGQSVGQAEIRVDGETVSVLTLVSAADVEPLHPYVEEKSFFEDVSKFFKKIFDK